MPDARDLPLGGPIYTIWNNHSGTCNVTDNAGGALRTQALDEVTHYYLLNNSTQAGTWLVQTVGTASHSSALSTSYDEFTLEIGVGVALNLNIRTMCDQLGYAGSNAARVYVYVGPQGGATHGAIGADSTGGPSLDTGTFPANSLIILTVLENGYIAGRGGDGGQGQIISSVTSGTATYGAIGNGTNGEDALHIKCDTVLYNYGKIQGGGGGGGGGPASGLVSGPGGGGGAGYNGAPGGDQGTFPFQVGCSGGGNGNAGSLDLAGLGGGHNNGGPAGTGGAGGDAGSAGTQPTNGGTGGQPGFAIKRDTSVTLTQAVAGTIDGAIGTL